ncbi:MAG: carbon monoxide dehydrogenase molybdoprotein family protein, partial [Anaerolineales bacterium]|nr:carbon monoxide dehydrogenase molybdoprotein family protein [Anaerolineales bacterium]
MTTVGRSLQRIDALGKVTGETLYPGDIYLPGMLSMKILFAGRPHAIVRRLDTERAKRMPGVVAVFTASDVPVNEYGLIMPDQPVLCGPGSAKPYADRVRFVGDQLAVVVAEDEAAAARALREIVVEFEDLPVVADVDAALTAGAPLLFPDRDSNVFCHYRIRKGDSDGAFRAADVVIQREYHTPVQEHAYLQPEAGVSYIDDEGRLTVEVAGQWTHEDQEQIAHALGLPLDQVRVIYPAIGGAFGGREDMSVQIVLALAVWRLSQRGLRRPVRIVWSREESILGHHKRHAYTIRSKWGARRDGRLLAAEVEILQDGGAYAYTSTKVLGNSTLLCTGPYEFPNVTVDAYSVYTNNIPGGAFRGFGGPQASFSAEMQMNLLAEALGIDPVEIRRRNLLREGALLSVGTPLPKGVSIDKVVDQCAEAVGWLEPTGKAKRPGRDSLGQPAAAHLRRGLGFACGFKNVGFSFGAPEHSWATVEIHGGASIERAVVYHAGAECGQGAHTVMAQMAAEALNLPMEKIELVVSDTARTGNSGSASASRMTFMAGNAIRGAAEQALAKWNLEERPAVGAFKYRPPATTPLDPQTGKSEPNFAYGYVAEAVALEVDVETGQIHLLDVVCADDVGKAVNPQQVEGQIEGAVVQAGGYAILENFIQDAGKVRTAHLSTYLIPTVLDIPDRVRSLILEYPDPIGPWGARGMGEMPYLPFVPAVAAAV